LTRDNRKKDKSENVLRMSNFSFVNVYMIETKLYFQICIQLNLYFNKIVLSVHFILISTKIGDRSNYYTSYYT